MPELPTSNLCANCGGDGLDGVDFCIPCSGSGYASTFGGNIYRKNIKEKLDASETAISLMTDKINDIYNKCLDIKEKVDEIKEVVDEL